MASTIMHLAIAKNLGKCNVISNLLRFQIGNILPDAITHGLANHSDSHFKATVCEGKKKVIDFASFKADFNKKILYDDLYLGYYFHLIQDGFYRKFLYYDYKYKVTCKDDVELLHNDYRLLNTYLISKYTLSNNLIIPDGFINEPINSIYPFSLNDHLKNINNHFTPFSTGKIAFFTEKMADEYISKCTTLCIQELENIKNGITCINPMDYAWDLHI